MSVTPAEYRPPGQPDPDDTGPVESGRAGVTRLVLIVAAVVVVAVAAGVGQTVAVLAAIVAMIVLHELGHFAMAKWADMKVTEFFVGFGTRLWSFRRGETEYGVKALPIGGYVKIIGMNNLEEVDEADEARSLRQKPYWRKLTVLAAGSAMHFLLALVMLYVLFAVVGEPGPSTLRIGAVEALTTGPSPAQQAGFRVGDRIVSIDGHPFATFPEAAAYISARPGQMLDVVVDRQGRLLHLTPTPVDRAKVAIKAPGGAAVAGPPTGVLGIVADAPTVRSGALQSFSDAGGQFVDLSARTFDALGGLVTAHGVSSYGHMLVNQKAADSPTATNRFVSPVGIARIANQAAKHGLSEVLYLLVLINVFVGIFNLVPLLPLDGGHIAVATYERIRSRKGRRYHADVLKLMPLTYGVVLLLAFIFVSSLFLDVRDLVSVVRF